MKNNAFQNPKEKLLLAIDQIEKFTKKRSEKSLPYFFRKPGKLIKLAKHFIPAIFSRKARKQLEIESRQVEEEVFKAIDDVKRYHPIFCKNKESEEYLLAKRAQKAIFDINRIIENNQKQPIDLSKTILAFMIKKKLVPFGQAYKISLPKDDFIPNKLKEIVDKKEITHALTGRELDVFRMKAISHVQKHSVLFSSVQDILTSVRNNPIYQQKKDENLSFVNLEQTFSPFPGETIIFTGSFENNTTDKCRAVPKNFDISFVSKQMGFPYPIQHTSWALAEALVAKMPLHPEKTPKLQKILQKKEAIAGELLNRGNLISKAKELLLFKRKDALNKSKELISLHKKLIFLILEAKNEKDTNTVLSFFNWINRQPTPYVTMAEIFQKFNDEQVVKPYYTLKSAWINQSEVLLFSHLAKERFSAATALFNIQLKTFDQYPKEVTNFINLLSKTLRATFQNIMLQSFSEMIDYPSPKLSTFEKVIQTSLYNQLELFIEELESKKPKSYIEILNRDIEIFENKLSDHPIVLELNSYYTQVNSKIGF